MIFNKEYDAFLKEGINPRFLLDLLTVQEGIRDYGLLHIERTQLNFIRFYFERNNLIEIAIRFLRFVNDEQSREGLFFDTSIEAEMTHAEIWYANKNGNKSESVNPFINPGLYLGYPDCCVNFYESGKGMGKFYNKYLFSNELRFTELNRLCTIFNPGLLMLDFFPCSLACKEAKAFVSKSLKIVEKHFPKTVFAEVNKHMKSPLLIIRDSLFSFPSYTIEKDKLILLVDDNSRSIKINSICSGEFQNKQVIEGNEPHLLRFKHLDNLNILELRHNNDSKNVSNIKYI